MGKARHYAINVALPSSFARVDLSACSWSRQTDAFVLVITMIQLAGAEDSVAIVFDVLQNLEFAIVQMARRHPEMSDWDALIAVETLMQVYRAEVAGREARPQELDPLAEEVCTVVRGMAEWRLGRGSFVDDAGEPMGFPGEAITAEEMYACLRRIRRSIQKWTKRDGRRGYLTYADRFFPSVQQAGG